MKGFTKKERRGIMVLCVVALLVAMIEPVSRMVRGFGGDVQGKESVTDTVPMFAPQSSLEAEVPTRIMKEERSEAHKHSDSIREVEKKHKTSAKKSKKSTAAPKKKSANPGKERDRRSERIDNN